MGAREHWMEIVGYIIEDLNWLLDLPFYRYSYGTCATFCNVNDYNYYYIYYIYCSLFRFWSNIIYNSSIIDTLVSFLQEAPPFYAFENLPAIPEMLEALEKLRHNVLMIFARLVTKKESLTEYMNCPFFGNLLYDNYIFTIPIIFDLCQLYGRENTKVIEQIVHKIFSLQPLYNDDLEKSVPCLIKVMYR